MDVGGAERLEYCVHLISSQGLTEKEKKQLMTPRKVQVSAASIVSELNKNHFVQLFRYRSRDASIPIPESGISI